MQISTARSYRCSYHPQDRAGSPASNDTGVLPFVQVKACSAEEAQRRAFSVTGCPIVSVDRIEVAA